MFYIAYYLLILVVCCIIFLIMIFGIMFWRFKIAKTQTEKIFSLKKPLSRVAFYV